MRLAQETVRVTRKGQVTIPVKYRRKYAIRQGMKLLVSGSPEGIVFKPLTPIEELAGVDASKVKLHKMRETLDRMRLEDRY